MEITGFLAVPGMTLLLLKKVMTKFLEEMAKIISMQVTEITLLMQVEMMT